MNVSENNEEAFGLVLNEISMSVLRTLNKSEHELADMIILGEKDTLSIFVLGRILVGICDKESDHKITSGIDAILKASALLLAKKDRSNKKKCYRNSNYKTVEIILAHDNWEISQIKNRKEEEIQKIKAFLSEPL